MKRLLILSLLTLGGCAVEAPYTEAYGSYAYGPPTYYNPGPPFPIVIEPHVFYGYRFGHRSPYHAHGMHGPGHPGYPGPHIGGHHERMGVPGGGHVLRPGHGF